MRLTQEDEDLLLNYAGSLVQLWLFTDENDYPLSMQEGEGRGDWIGVLGLPKVSYQFKFNSREELWGRILILGHLLGATELQGKNDEGQFIQVKLI